MISTQKLTFLLKYAALYIPSLFMCVKSMISIHLIKAAFLTSMKKLYTPIFPLLLVFRSYYILFKPFLTSFSSHFCPPEFIPPFPDPLYLCEDHVIFPPFACVQIILSPFLTKLHFHLLLFSILSTQNIVLHFLFP